MYVAFEVALTYLYARWYTFLNRGFRHKQCNRRLRYRHMFKTSFLQKVSITSKPHDRFFSNFSKQVSIVAAKNAGQI